LSNNLLQSLQKNAIAPKALSITFNGKFSVRYIAHSMSYNESCFLIMNVVTFNELVMCYLSTLDIAHRVCDISTDIFPCHA